MWRRLSLALPYALPLLVGVLLSSSVVLVRMACTGRMWFRFMLWNLFLAAVPYALAVALRARWERGHKIGFAFVGLALAWLAFFPNAPYMLTDFIHLTGRRTDELLWWYDGVLVASCAATAWGFGLVSLSLVHGVLREAAGVWFARFAVVLVCWLSGVGVYLGRFLRFNSWDVLRAPGAVIVATAQRFAPPTAHPRTHAFAFGFALLLLASYLAARWLARRIGWDGAGRAVVSRARG